MKKIFSMLLATALLFGMLLPMSVSAADPVVRPTGTTEILFPNFAATAIKYLKSDGSTIGVTSGVYPLANMFRMIDGVATTAGRTFNPNTDTAFKNGADVVALVYDVPVTVEEAGTYTVTLLSSVSNADVKLVVGGNEYQYFNYTILDNTQQGTDEPWTYCNSAGVSNKNYAGAEYHYKVPFTQGSNTITIKVPKEGLSSTIVISSLYIRNETAIIDSNTVTTVELEDYASPSNLGDGARVGIDGTPSEEALVTYFRNDKTSASAAWYDIKGTLPISDGKRAFFIKANTLYTNSYPYSVNPRSVTDGTAIKKLVEGVWTDYTPDAADVNTIQYGKADGSSSNYIVPPSNPLYQGSLDVKIPIQVKTKGTYQFDLMCLTPYYASANKASTIDLFVGDPADGESIGKAYRYTGVSANSGASVIFDTEPTIINTRSVYPYLYSNKYFSQNVLTTSSSGAYNTPLSRYVFEADLDPSDEYITLAINPLGMGSMSERAANIDVTFYTIIDSLTITGADVANTISASPVDGKVTGSVKYNMNQRTYGYPVLALYNDGELVAVKKWDVRTIGEPVVDFEIAYDGDYDTAKVFIWEDYDTTFKPKVAVKTITVN